MSAAKNNCPICRSSLSGFQRNLGAGPWFDCPACGRYGVGEELLLGDGSLAIEDKTIVRLSHLLCERRLKKSPAVFLSLRTMTPDGYASIPLGEFLANYPRSPREYYDRALENLARMVERPTASLELPPEARGGLFSEGFEIVTMFKALAGLGYVDGELDLFSITPKGWERIQHLQATGRDSTQAFVAMWFDPSQQDTFDKGIRPAIEADGRTRALRIDGKEHNDHIDDQIIAEIRRSRYLVADFTGHRKGVYFEAGFALGLGIPVIWCCAKHEIDEAHFDTRQYNHITYENPEELRVKLLNRIRATVV